MSDRSLILKSIFLIAVVVAISLYFSTSDLKNIIIKHQNNAIKYQIAMKYRYRKKGQNVSIKLFLWPKESARFELFNFTTPSVLEGNRRNEAVRGHGECKTPLFMVKNAIADCKDIQTCKTVVVTHIIDIDDGKHFTNFAGYRIPTKEEMQAFFKNLYYILQENLNNPKIKAVVVLCESEIMAERLHHIDFENSTKLSIQNINTTITMGNQIAYASKCFQDEIVNVANQDIAMGDGWETIDINKMKTNKIMFALTRYPSRLNCFATSTTSNCIQHRGIGSYDAFIWHVKQPIMESIFVDKLGKSKPSTKGMENVVVWIFQNVLKYEVDNPCLSLKIHHEHCVPIRDSKQGARVNTNGISGIAKSV